jgi:hypothetical protein
VKARRKFSEGLAWTVFACDALLALVVVGAGLGSGDSVERDSTLALAAIGAAPFLALFAIIFFSARHGSRVGLWIGALIGAVPLALVVEVIGEQHGLWMRM